MGRPINKRYFGSGAGNQLKVRAKIGANAEGAGVIVAQKGSNRFRVTVGANTATCVLVDKANNTLLANEMTVTVQTDAGVLKRATKLYSHVAIVEGSKVPWNFAASLTDGAAQVAEVEAGLPPIITITSQPTDGTIATATAGQIFSVIATVTQSGSLTYLWQVSTNGGSTWASATGGVYTGGTTAALSVTASTGLNGYDYRVIVSSTGAASVTSNAVNLTVTP